MATPAAPAFDPNAALRQFNEYFGNLRKTQGEAAIRAAGFTPRDLSALQATLRRLQMDPNATPEQHQQAYQQARDTLAQRLTTPAATAPVTPPPQEIVVTGTPRPSKPEPAPAPPPMPRYMGELPPAPPVAPLPVNFDRNAALQQFNKNFGDMRQKYGNEFFTSQGFTPRDLAALQGNLRNLQLDPNSTQSQHDAALKNAMDTLNQRLLFPVEPSPMPPAAQPSNPVSDFIANMNAPKPPATGMLNPVGPAPTPPIALPGGMMGLLGGAPPTLAQTRPDPEFNINTATNTFYKQLGDRVASGQMTLDQARAAQAEMRALQLNPAMANRQAATDIAQRHLQVGPYSPNNVAQRQLTPAVNAEAGIPLWRQLAPSPERDAAMQAAIQPKFIGKNFTGDAPPPGKKYIETGEGLVPVPINDTYVKPQGMTTGIGGSLGAQMMPAPMPMAQPRGLTLSNVPQQGVAPQPMTAPTGMAMGGLMTKYRGGMC